MIVDNTRMDVVDNAVVVHCAGAAHFRVKSAMRASGLLTRDEGIRDLPGTDMVVLFPAPGKSPAAVKRKLQEEINKAVERGDIILAS